MMNRAVIASIALKVLAVVVWLEGLEAFIPSLVGRGDRRLILEEWLLIGGPATAGALLYFLSDRLANRMAREKETGGSVELQAVAFSVVGVWTMVLSLSVLLWFGPMLLVEHVQRVDVEPDSSQWKFLVSTTVARLLTLGVGVALFLGGRGLASVWRKAQAMAVTRTTGQVDAPPPDESSRHLAIALSVLGLYLMVSALCQWPAAIVPPYLHLVANTHGTWVTGSLVGLAQIVIGLILFLRSRSIASLWWRLQSLSGEGVRSPTA